MAIVAAEGTTLNILTTWTTIFEGLESKTYEGKIDLENLIAGDTIEVKGEEIIKSGGAYGKYKDNETYDGPRDDTAGKSRIVGFQPRTNKYGYKISARMTSATPRIVPFIFFKV